MRSHDRSTPLGIGVVGTALALAFSWIPSLWGDEAATVTSVTRSWSELRHMVGSIDAVHALYYLLLKLWVDAVGYSPFALRLPSAVAIGVAAALVTVLGTRLAGRGVGLAAGIAFLLLPRVAWAGTDGRPYALVAALAVATTLLCLEARDAPDRRRAVRLWVAYAVVAVVAVVLNLFLVLVVVAHGVVLLAGRADGPCRDQALAGRASAARHAPLVGWTAAAAAAAILTAPFALEVIGQAGQVSWIPPVGPTTVRHVLVDAWFRSTWPFSPAALSTLVVVPVGWALLAVGTLSARRGALVRVALPLAALPTVLLLVATAAGVRLYSPQYATMSTPFVALLVGAGAVRILRWSARRVGRRSIGVRAGARGERAGARGGRAAAVRVVGVAAVICTAVPSLVAVKLPHAKWDTSWSEAAAIVGSARGTPAATADGVVYGTLADAPWVDSRLIAAGYPVPFHGMRDLGVHGDARAAGRMWDENGDVGRTIPARLRGIRRVWYLGDRDDDPLLPTVHRALRRGGLAETSRRSVGRVLVVEFRRASWCGRGVMPPPSRCRRTS